MKTESDSNGGEGSEVADVIHATDIKVGQSLASQRNHPFVRWCCGVGDLGDQGPLYLMGATLLVSGLVRSSPRCFMTGASMLLGVGISDATKTHIKHRVKRSRPDELLDNGNYEIGLEKSRKKEEQSFPSGHVAATVAAARSVSRFYPGAAPHVTCAAAIITLSRVVKGKHWPLDLAAGSVIGLASHWVADIVIKRVAAFIPSLSRGRV